MVLQENRIAIVSPSKWAYSETFIQAQKNELSGQVYYYYGAELPEFLEGHGCLSNDKIFFLNKLKQKIKLTNLNSKEEALIKSFKQNKIQVVLAHYGPTGHRLVDICSLLKIPLVTHFHGYDASEYQIVNDYNFYKKLFLYSSKIIAVSRVMETKLIEMGCAKEKIIYNVYGPKKAFEDITPTYKKKQFLSVGRFTDKKAPYYTIMGFQKVIEKHPDAKLLMAGDGALLNMCKNLVKQLYLDNNVIFLGVITPNEYMSLLSESLAFVQHSIIADNGDMEGTPVSILEASAAGLPIISTYHAGIPDVIINDKTGLLCDEHDIETMSINMLRVLNDIDYAQQLGKEGKLNIKENFSIEQHISNLNDILENVSIAKNN